MAILGKIEPERIDLKELIQNSLVLDALQKTQLLILATKIEKKELTFLLKMLQEEKAQINFMQTNYQVLIEKYEDLAEKKVSEINDQIEVDNLINQLNQI